jgi:hypothetical protein
VLHVLHSRFLLDCSAHMRADGWDRTGLAAYLAEDVAASLSLVLASLLLRMHGIDPTGLYEPRRRSHCLYQDGADRDGALASRRNLSCA